MAICAACYIGLDPTIPRARAILHDVDQSSFPFLLGPADLPQIAFSSDVPGTGPEVFAAAAAKGLEDIVSKDLTSRYRSGPSFSWLKTKAFGEADFHLIGLARSEGTFRRAPRSRRARRPPLPR
jgi:ATP-dependent DNA ligase